MTELIKYMPFTVKDCTLITRMAGIGTAMNLRELQERVSIAPIECLFHHFCETVLRPTFDDPEYHNDFAVWAARHLRDRVLAERLAILNPYKESDFEELRRQLIDIFEERLAEVPYIPWVPRGHDFQFMRAVTVVFSTGVELHSAEDFVKQLPQMSLSSIYYHFVEARRRRDDGRDDFSGWLADHNGSAQALIEALGNVDFYFFSLTELKRILIEAVSSIVPEPSS